MYVYLITYYEAETLMLLLMMNDEDEAKFVLTEQYMVKNKAQLTLFCQRHMMMMIIYITLTALRAALSLYTT